MVAGEGWVEGEVEGFVSGWTGLLHEELQAGALLWELDMSLERGHGRRRDDQAQIQRS